MTTEIKILKNTKLRNAEYYSFQEIQDELYRQSQDNKIFNKLIDKITMEENILLAYRNIKRNKGSKTAGTDNIDHWHTCRMENRRFYKAYSEEKSKIVNTRNKYLEYLGVKIKVYPKCIKHYWNWKNWNAQQYKKNTK